MHYWEKKQNKEIVKDVVKKQKEKENNEVHRKKNILERRNVCNCEAVSKFRNGIKKGWNRWRKIPSPVLILCFPTKPFSPSIFFSRPFCPSISDGWSPLSPLSSCGIFSQLLFVFHALIPHSGGLQSLQRNGSCCQQLKWVCGCFVWAAGLVILWVFSLYLTRIKPLLMRVEMSSAGCCCNSQGSHHLLLEKCVFTRPVRSSDFIFGFCKGKHVKTGQSEIPALCLFFSLHFFTPFLASVKRHAALRQWLTAQVRNVFACPSESVCLLHRTHSYSCHVCNVQMLWNAAERDLTSQADADYYAQYSASKHCLPLQGLIMSRIWTS